MMEERCRYYAVERAQDGCGMKQLKRDKIIDVTVFVVLLLVVSAVTLTLFYWQTTGNPQKHHSDMKAYILEMQGLESGYEFPYPVFFKLSAFINLLATPEWAVAIATMLLNTLAIVVTKVSFNRLLLGKGYGDLIAGGKGFDEKAAGISCVGEDVEATVSSGRSGKWSWCPGVVISLACIALFFISMLFPPKGIYLPGIKHNYLGVFTPNPFHNATYMAARPFAILAFLWYVKLLPVYEKGMSKASGTPGTSFKAALKWENAGQSQGTLADYILFSVFLLLATMTKPSFTLVLVSTAGLLMLYRMIRSGFRNFMPTVQLGLCFIPTFVDLLYQYKGVFVPEEGAEGGVGFCFGEIWSQTCDNIPLAVCLAVGFPLMVLVLNFKKCKKNTLFLFSWQFFVVSFLEAFLLYEKGFRKYDFNFSWGYMCGIFFCHFGALLVLLQSTMQIFSRENKAEVTKWQKLFVVGQWLAYIWHLSCGLRYFMVIFSGKMYY